jgi:hypothetical protein
MSSILKIAICVLQFLYYQICIGYLGDDDFGMVLFGAFPHNRAYRLYSI